MQGALRSSQFFPYSSAAEPGEAVGGGTFPAKPCSAWHMPGQQGCPDQRFWRPLQAAYCRTLAPALQRPKHPHLLAWHAASSRRPAKIAADDFMAARFVQSSGETSGLAAPLGP